MNAPVTKNFMYSSFILLECLLWGVGNTVTKVGLQSVSPFYSLSIRFSMAFVLFVLFFHRRLLTHRAEVARLIPISVSTAFAFILSTLSLIYTSATTAGLLMSLSVVFTPFLVPFINKIPFDRKILRPLILVVTGMYFLCGNGGTAQFGVGEIMALVSSLCLAVALTYSANYLSTTDPVVLSAVQSGVTAIIALAFALLFEDARILPSTSMSGWLCMIYLAVGCTFIAYLLQNTALQRVSPVFVSIAFCTEPIFTALSAYLVFDEKLSLSGYAGALLILVGVVITALPKREAKPRVKNARLTYAGEK